MEGNVDQLCPFCRAPATTSDEENTKLVMKRVDMGDAIAIYNLACFYADEMYGIPHDMDKALELWHQAGELGKASAYNSIGYAYYYGNGVERDIEKAKHYWELAAMNGDVQSRYNLGIMEGKAGNYHRGMKHYVLAAKAGFKPSLDKVKEGFKHGLVTRDEYANSLRANQSQQDKLKSDARDKARAHINNGVMRV